ncbi:superoxide dismutase [Candidatus Roizmanbacteria bacterium RIFCSPHIGHO2_01_FULL_39_12b]|uniref:Superoxide dismutase n=1 Tax=Candidatus Roizmanbacteria bacterium RIFCSPHIGHO2_01_FULL_39_12b TaxID=1802030 RepID=A0A1F7GCI8_9BACT|nr:MAG: superoxide dismutase [Candidatus Roizmanbacteria bacterium RIFCSPHIGHO2_01_FULL_39_12b]OGK47115.1 MAG: superoxide dismutase [Candidatus Roizmanbacteria bacterium RIFCSPLOWO2_01_FULL_39_19]
MFTLTPLPYQYNALEPFIDGETMMFHHNKHHAVYIDNLNKALERYPEWQEKTIEEIIKNLNSIPENIRPAVANNGGGHLNHTFFWDIMTPVKGQKPEGELLETLISTFGSVEEFMTQFENAGLTRFGSGWAWLVVEESKSLKIISTANQDSPLSLGMTPILGVDVWEHAYYLKYQNRRVEYLKNFWNIVNFKQVEENFKQAH